MSNFKQLADTVQSDIAAGRLGSGNRLPPQRTFADARRIAMSTAGRVYAELARRGLVVGEVGRGTFVRSGSPKAVPLGMGIGQRINLATNIPILPRQASLFAKSTAALTRRAALMDTAMEAVAPAGTVSARRTVAQYLARGHWRPNPEGLCFAGNGRQALAAVLASLVPPGQRLGVEALSYQSVTGIAARLGIEVVALPVDEHGLRADGVVTAHRRAPLRAVYVQPTLHNPLGITMPLARRRELVSAFQRLDVIGIEDHVYAFLVDDPSPLAALAPEQIILIDSLSKRIAPGLTLGYVLAPPRLAGAVAESVRAGGLVPSGLALALCSRWIADGTVGRLVRDKRRDALARQRLLRKTCPDMSIQADPRAYHAWIRLPPAWRAETFTAAAAQTGIAVAPSSAFAAGPGHAPNAIRLALACPPLKVLAGSLATLNELVRASPARWGLE